MSRVLFLLIYLFFSNRILAQYQSLLSANGEGRILSPVFSVNKFGGELTAGYSNSIVCNQQNPASYADALLTTIEFGIRGEEGNFKYRDSINRSGGISMSNFSMLMPMKLGKSGFSIGLYQRSNADFGVINYYNDSSFGKYSKRTYGTGGVYEAYMGMGFKFGHFKVGANLRANFASVNYYELYSFVDSNYFPSTRVTDQNSIFGLGYNLGAQYDYYINKKSTFVFGAYYRGDFLQSTSNTYKRDLIYFNTSSTGSVDNFFDSVGSTKYPKTSKFGIGFNYIANQFVNLGIEYNNEDFTNYYDRINKKYLQNAWHLHIGTEINPSLKREADKRKYLNRIIYRAGIIMGKSEQNYTNSFNDVKVTAGLSFPLLNRSVAYISIGGAYQNRGFGSLNTVQESLFSTMVTISFSDKWFIKSKFD